MPLFRRYIWNLARIAALGLVATLVVALIYLVNLSAAFTAAALSPSRLPLTRTPADVGIADYEDVSLTTADGLTLRGWYVPSRNGAAILVMHGHANNRTQLLDEARILSEAGYGVLLLDWRAHGESDGDHTTFGSDEQLDVEAALDYLASRPDVNPERIGGLGFSMGAVTLAMAAARDERLQVVILEAGAATFRDTLRWWARPLPLVGELAPMQARRLKGVDVDESRPVDVMCAISPRPVLLIYGTEERYVMPDSGARMFAAACEPKELWLIEGAAHGGFAGAAGPDEYARRIIAFFDMWLGRQ
jgi:dipeptidyl aminopeptidase/acylaminoacyl peptidase